MGSQPEAKCLHNIYIFYLGFPIAQLEQHFITISRLQNGPHPEGMDELLITLVLCHHTVLNVWLARGDEPDRHEAMAGMQTYTLWQVQAA